MELSQPNHDTLRSKAIDFAAVFFVMVGVASLLGYTSQSLVPAAVVALVAVWRKYSRAAQAPKVGNQAAHS